MKQLMLLLQQLLPHCQRALLLLLLLVSFLVVATPPRARVFNEAGPVHNATFDYIVVGGGASGCSLAATLSQKFKVLLLERGGSPYNSTAVERREGFYAGLLQADNQTSPVERFVSEDGVPGHRGRVLGGGTAVNAGFYSRARAEDVEAAGWDQQLVDESFQWVEDKLVEFPSPPEWQLALKKALVEAGVGPDNGFTYLHKLGCKIGGSIFDRKGIRHSSADLLQLGNAGNLVVMLYATVTRVVLVRGTGQKPKAIGVEYLDKEDRAHTAFLNSGAGEVILAAGALGSPQLLMLSGIGPENELKLLGIPLVLNLPSVGEGVGDNPNNAIISVQKKDVRYSLVEVVGVTSFGSYIEELSGGEYADVVFKALTSLLTSPQKEENTQALSTYASEFRTYYSRLVNVYQKVASPKSKGKLRLTSANPKAAPSVRYNYLQHDEDLATCVRGVRKIWEVLRTPAFSKLAFPNISSMPATLGKLASAVSGLILPEDVTNNTRMEEFCKGTLTTIWHNHGGCNMGSVVDSEYRVLGADALRVVDISTFPDAPGTNPQATIMMLGRYMGVRISNYRLS